MNKTLLLIDYQLDYFPGGKMELTEPEVAAEKAKTALHYFRVNELPVVHIRHEALQEGATFFLPDSNGARIYPLLSPLDNETIFTKHYPNSFRETGLLEFLHSIESKELVIAGMMTHMCVDSTVRAVFDLGFSVVLLHDACATRELSFGRERVSAESVRNANIAALQRFARVKATAEFFQEG